MNSTTGIAQIGQWYERVDKGGVFQVTGLDERDGTVEIQDLDGNIDEIDAEAWAAVPLVRAEPPEDWIEPVDEMDAEDLTSVRAESTLEDPAVLQRLA